MNVRNAQNLSMLCDFYELTMSNGYFRNGYKDRITYFDLFFRQVPDGGGFAIAAGLEQVVEYITNLHFSDADIDYLRSRGIFCEEFLQYLRNFRFTGDIWAVPEGTPVFPREPLITVRAPAIEAQLVETYLLLAVNHQSLIATKASRIVRAARGRAVMEFGSRRAQGADAAILGARAAYIAGCSGTACTISDQLYGVPALGTMAHSWVQMFDSEYEAFRTYCESYPTNAVLLVDTYNTLKSGIPNAIRAFNDVLKPMGITKCGIRLDSGDMSYLTKEARRMLDEAGWAELHHHLLQLARRIYHPGPAAAGRVHRLLRRRRAAHHRQERAGVRRRIQARRRGGRESGEVVPKIKVSENVAKITIPHFKKFFRFYDRTNGKALADYLCLYDETPDDTQPLTIFHPENTWKRKTLTNFRAENMMVPVFRAGELVYDLPSLKDIRKRCAEQLETLWPEVLRFENPHGYYVDLSNRLWDIRHDLLVNAGHSQIPEKQ